MESSPNFFLLSFIYLLQGVTGTLEQSKLVLTKGCACPGGTLTYDCSIVGDQGGATIWFGSAFNCASNESVLFHNRFTDTGTLDECNDGAIVARSLSANGNIYTSQLNVTITPGIAGKTIMCIHDPLTGQCQTQTNRRLSVPLSIVVPADMYPPPSNLYISNTNLLSRQLTFSWSPVASDCPAIHYSILASNCGSCPTTTNHTAATCTDIPTDGSNCTFAIRTVVCENITGRFSEAMNVILAVDMYAKFQGNIDSLSALVAGGILISLALVLIVGFIIFEVIKRSKICPRLQSSQLEQNSNQNTKMGNQMQNLSLDNDNYNHFERTHLDLNSVLLRLSGKIPDSQWYQFGLAIGISKGILNQLEHYPAESRLAELLDYWLKHHRTGQPTWKEITDAYQQISELDNQPEYSYLNKHTSTIIQERSQRHTSSINKPRSIYTEDVYDKTSHT